MPAPALPTADVVPRHDGPRSPPASPAEIGPDDDGTSPGAGPAGARAASAELADARRAR